MSHRLKIVQRDQMNIRKEEVRLLLEKRKKKELAIVHPATLWPNMGVNEFSSDILINILGLNTIMSRISCQIDRYNH